MSKSNTRKYVTVISPPDLFTLLCSPKPVLLLDVRRKEDFSKERIWASVHLDLETFRSIHAIDREIYITRNDGLDDNDQCPVTPYNQRNLFVNRELYTIVLVDESGSDERSLCAQLQHTTTDKETYLLIGGYKMFSMLYPSLCVGSPSQDEYLINKCEKEWSQHSPVEILPYLFFGDVASAQNFRAIDLLRIDSMVNAAVYVNNFAPNAYTYTRCDLEELPFGDLVPLFNKIFSFVETAKRKESKVLVYSASDEDGRAGMVVCAYLIKLNEWSMEQAFLTFKKKCCTFSPNVAILTRLAEYEVAVSGTKHVQEWVKGTGTGDRLVSDELKYIRRQQAQQFADSEAEAQAVEAEVEENLC